MPRQVVCRAAAIATLWMLSATACDPPPDTPGAAPPPDTSTCPACECECEAGSASADARFADSDRARTSADDDPPRASSRGGGGTDERSPGAARQASAGELAELSASISRKLMHEDGAGCLKALDTLRGLDARLGAQMEIQRGRCEMLTGQCQAGKARVSTWYQSEMAFSKTRGDTMAESLASMHCRGGDATARDKVLAAIFELSNAAYVETKDTRYCQQRIKTIRDLGPAVQAKSDPMSTNTVTIRGALQALFHTGATCLARAGNCRAAYRHWEAGYPAPPATDGSTYGGKYATARKDAIRAAFKDNIVGCP